MYIQWTDEETAILKDMIDKGAGYDELMKVFPARTLKSLSCKVFDLGLKITHTVSINHSAYQEFLKSIKQEKVKNA
jgi:hypothetical protein